MDDTRNEVCRKVLETPLEDIREDVFFRADNFQNEPWYGEFQIYRNLGVCQPKPEHVLEVQKALKVMGYPTHAAERNGNLSSPRRKTARKHKDVEGGMENGAAGGTERSCLSAVLEIFPAKGRER